MFDAQGSLRSLELLFTFFPLLTLLWNRERKKRNNSLDYWEPVEDPTYKLGSWCNFALHLLCCDYIRAKFQRERKVLMCNNNNNRKWGPERAGRVMDWLLFSVRLLLIPWRQRSLLLPQQPAYTQALTPLALCVPGSRYAFLKRKEEKVFLSVYFLLCREVFHCFGLTALLANFHSAVKKRKKKNLSKCWYHFQTVLSASQLTGNSWCSQTSPLFTHRPGALKKSSSPGEVFPKCHRWDPCCRTHEETSPQPGAPRLSFPFWPRQDLALPAALLRCPSHVSLWQPLLRAQLFLKPTGK